MKALLALAFVALLGAHAPDAAAQQPMTLKAAYDAGRVIIDVETMPGETKGERLKLTIAANEKPVTVNVTTEPVVLNMGMPFDSVSFRATAAQKLDLKPGVPATVIVTQLRELRFVKAKFQIMMDGGQPAYVGSATTDHVK